MDDIAETGTLYIVATPLGNLKDITLRAIETLKSVDTIACEDTRRASILLRHFDIAGKKLLSYHSFNESRAVRSVMNLLAEGSDVALVTDAGTPAISDPGYAMVRAASELPARVIPVPGACAATAALSACPLPLHNFYFAGFLPHKKGRKSKLEFLASIHSTVVFYESPGRIGRLLREVDDHFPGAEVFIAREITKIHEEYVRGTAPDLLEHFSGKTARGEFVVVVCPAGKKQSGSPSKSGFGIERESVGSLQ